MPYMPMKKHKNNLIEKKCVVCNTNFFCKSHGNYRELSTCSAICRKKRKSLYGQLRREANRAWKEKTRTMKQCLVCGKNFYGRSNTVCSLPCRKKRRANLEKNWRKTNRDYVNRKKREYYALKDPDRIKLESRRNYQKYGRKYKEVQKSRYHKNAEYRKRVLACCKEYRESSHGKEIRRQYYLRNKNRLRAKARIWAHNNREKLRAKAQRFYDRHRDRLIILARERSKKNKIRREMGLIAYQICVELGLEKSIRERLKHETRHLRSDA